MSCLRCGCEGLIGCSHSECPKRDVWVEVTARPPEPVKPQKVEKPVKEKEKGKGLFD